MKQEPINITPTNSRLLGIKELMQYLNIGRNLAMQFADESQARVKIGRRVLYDKHKIDKYINKLTEV